MKKNARQRRLTGCLLFSCLIWHFIHLMDVVLGHLITRPIFASTCTSNLPRRVKQGGAFAQACLVPYPVATRSTSKSARPVML
ncbi:hypothetical protein F5B21DRAFT_457260 [Xylaria acuta]|nr:hypothetical protein F5B21DRAFT_457260 [Xylaria acuta]